MNEKEYHIFIIWEKGRNLESELINKIETEFEVVQTFSVKWSLYQVSNNFTRFYGANLPKNSDKEKHCGKGEFKLVVVKDNKPNYDIRQTSKGPRRVNTNMFDTKKTLRELTGGGHKIHGTDSEQETRHNVALLLGLSLGDFLQKYTKRTEDIKLERDISGSLGWDSFDQLFYILNECSEYLVLRNADNINEEYFINNDGDVDLLARNSDEVKYVLGDLNSINEKREHMYVAVNNNEVKFEVYNTGENLFHESFENALFKQRRMFGNIVCLQKEMEFFGLIYHALLMKPKLSEKHKHRLKQNYSEFLDNGNVSESALESMLINYFAEHGYEFTPPDVGYFNVRSGIEKLLLKNRNRDSYLLRQLKKILLIDVKNREINVTIANSFNNRFSLKLKIIRGIKIGLYIGNTKC
ncbi:hypothetical protein AB4536_17040 [Vibrio cyclitrophicus]